MNIQRKKEGFLNLFDAVVYLERCSFFEKFTCLFYALPYSLFMVE